MFHSFFRFKYGFYFLWDSRWILLPVRFKKDFTSCEIQDGFYFLWVFLPLHLLVVFHLSMSDSKSPQISKNLWSILSDPNNAAVWMVLICLPISNSFSPFSKHLESISSEIITIGITVTLLFHNFFDFLSVVCQDGKIHYTANSFCWLSLEIRWFVFISKSYRILGFILQDNFWFVHVPFGSMVKFRFLAHFPVDHLPTLSCLVLYFLCTSLLHSLMWLIV